MEAKTILIIEDDELIRKILNAKIGSLGYRVLLAGDGEKALHLLKEEKIDLVLCDIFLPKMNGFEILKHIRTNYPEDLLVIMMTAYANIKTAVKAMEIGAFDYLIKPFNMEEIPYVLNRTFAFQSFIRSKKTIKKTFRFPELTGSSKYIGDLKNHLAGVIKNSKPVILIGEAGTGRKYLSDIIARQWLRNKKQVACFINADNVKKAELEKSLSAGGSLKAPGVIVLEKSDKLSFQLQDWLFKKIQSGKEGKRMIFISSEPKSTYEMNEYFIQPLLELGRENIIQTRPLRDHKEDIPLYMEEFLKKYNEKFEKQVHDVNKNALYFLLHYHWPGNISELESSVEYAVFHCRDILITPALLHKKIIEQKDMEIVFLNPGLKYKDALKLSRDEIDRHYFKIALKATNDNKSRAAKLLGVSLRQFQYRVKALGL